MNPASSVPRPKIRLYVAKEFAAGVALTLNAGQSHYLANVMRVQEGEAIAVFNGIEGEWLAQVAALEKRSVTLHLERMLQKQKFSPDLWLAFAPIKNKVDIVVEKAVELGVSAILPVVTRFSVVRTINYEKLMAHAVEAAEQCGRHDVPSMKGYDGITQLLAAWPKDRTLLYADESGDGVDLKTLLPQLAPGKYGLLVGPEGGFAVEEQRMLKVAEFVQPFGLGPRILRADTASVAALACVQAWLGDWQEQPRFEAAG